MASSSSQCSKLSRRGRRTRDSSRSVPIAGPSRSTAATSSSTIAQNSGGSASTNENPTRKQIDQVTHKVKRMKLNDNKGNDGGDKLDESVLQLQADFTFNLTLDNSDSESLSTDSSGSSDEPVIDMETSRNLADSDGGAEMSVDDIAVVQPPLSIDAFNANSSSDYLLCKILSYLPLRDLLNCKLVSKRWYQLIKSMLHIQRMVIFLRDTDSVELDNNTKHEIMVHMESFGFGVNVNVHNSRKVHYKTLADIHAILSDRRQDSWPVDPRTLFPVRPKIGSPLPILRQQVWIYTVNSEGTGREVEYLFRNHRSIISHLSVIQTKEPGQMSPIQLFKWLEILRNDLEYLELSLFPPSTSTTLKDTTVYEFKMKELRILRFGNPLEWLNLLANASTVIELLRISERLEQIHNFPFLPNTELGHLLPQKHVALGAVTSFYLNGSVILDFLDSEQARDDYIDRIFALYNGDTCPCPALSYLKIESSRCYQTEYSVESFNKILRASKDTLTAIEMFPPISSRNTLEFPIGLTKVKKLTLFDDQKEKLPFFSMDASMGPNFLLHFPNLECVQLNLESVSAEVLDYYFPIEGDLCEPLVTVARLKINMELGKKLIPETELGQWVQATAIQKLGKIFPNVKQLELKPQKNTINNVILAGSRELQEILPVIPDVWPKLTHLTLILSQLSQLRGIPDNFVTDTMPKLKDLISLKFRFPAHAIMTPKPDQFWKFELQNYMRRKYFPYLNVYVQCGWRISRSGIEELNKFFEPLKGLPSCYFNF